MPLLLPFDVATSTLSLQCSAVSGQRPHSVALGLYGADSSEAIWRITVATRLANYLSISSASTRFWLP